MKIKTYLISDCDSYDFKQKLNSFLEELEQDKIIDIKFSTTYSSMIWYSALIIYKEKKKKEGEL